MRRLFASASLAVVALTVACSGGDSTAPNAPLSGMVPPLLATASDGNGLSITTDKDDYTPGDTVWFTGAGWQPGDTLDIVLVDEPQTHAPHTWTIPVSASGDFRDSSYVVDIGDLGVTFTLTATSRATTQALTVQFTDAALNSVVTFTINGSAAQQTVSAGGLLSWSFRATCLNGGGTNTCVNGGFSGEGAAVSNGYLADIEESTTLAFSPAPTVTVRAAAQATAGGNGIASGSFTAPTTPGSYYFRARHTNQVGLLQGAISNNFGAAVSTVIEVIVLPAPPTDNSPPVVSSVAVSPSLTNGTANVTVTGNVDDASTGNSNITAASYSIDGGSPIAMSAVSTFDSPTENVTATILAAAVAALSNGEHTVCVRGTDAAGNTSSFAASGACTTLTVDKVSPVVSSVAVNPSLTNGTVSVALTANVDDASTGNADVVSAAYNIDGGSAVAMTASDAAFDSPSENATASIPAAVVAALSNGQHTVCVQGTDAAGNTSSFAAANACATLTVDKVPPIVSSVQASPNPTNGSVAVTLSASVSDATTGNSNIVSAVYSIDGGAPIAMSASDLNFDSAIEGVTATISPPLAEGSYQLCVRGTDAAGNTSAFTDANACTTLIVDKTPPIISNFNVAPNPVAVNTPFTISATFTDALTNVVGAQYSLGGTGGPWVALPNAGGSYDSNTENGSATISLPNADVLNVCVRSTDQVGNTNQPSPATNPIQCVLLAVYDPSAGFVTGGGWLMSPAGAYVADPTLTGKATFGFVSKYLKGANIPTGNTEFHFHAGELKFSSTTYDWLVVSQNGVRAQYKGYGTLNGQSGYGFLLTALDQSPDLFRIKIWNTATSAIVYDNQMGSADESNDATGISGGSIIIHVPKK